MNNAPEPVNVLIADTQTIVIEGLLAWLREGFIIQDVVHTYKELAAALCVKVPEVIIMDYTLPDYSSFDDLKTLRMDHPGMGLIVFSNNYTRYEITELKNIGIKNIIHKSTSREELFECLHAILKGKNFYCHYVMDILFEVTEKKDFVSGSTHLTASEIEIVRLIGEGLTNKEIAQRKFLSIHTIMTHRKNILRKLNVSSASELIIYAIKAGIIDNIEYHI
jgi:DNA-binding NarL/FixJ family response regulator